MNYVLRNCKINVLFLRAFLSQTTLAPRVPFSCNLSLKYQYRLFRQECLMRDDGMSQCNLLGLGKGKKKIIKASFRGRTFDF